MQRSDFSHIIQQDIRWGDMDALGHVNNIMFFRYLESGRIAYMEALFPGENVSANSVLADVQCSFRRQLHYPGGVEVGTRVSRLGNRSLRLIAGLFIKDDPDPAPAATAQAALVWFDFNTQRAMPLPERLRQAIIEREKIPPEQD